MTDEAPLEAELLLRHVTGLGRSALIAWPDAPLDAATRATLAPLLGRRLAGEPLAYVIGTREFWSMELEVSPAVLIPRPDTETLVERSLALLGDDTDADADADAEGWVIELGTGSGAVAIALASECPNPVIATDLSAAALAVAGRNARRHLPPGRLGLLRADWLCAFADERAALVVSNPPYLADDDPHLASLAGEPRSALVSGADGLDAIAVIADRARAVLVPGGSIALEHGHEQGEAVRAILTRGGFGDVTTTRDLAGHERVSEGRRP